MGPPPMMATRLPGRTGTRANAPTTHESGSKNSASSSGTVEAMRCRARSGTRRKGAIAPSMEVPTLW